MLIKLATILVSLSGVGVGGSFQRRKQAVMTLVSTEACISTYVCKQAAFTKYLFILFMCIHTLCICMYTICMQMPFQATRGSCSESKLSLLQEQQLLLNADPQAKVEMILTWGTRRLLGVECLRLQTEDGKGYHQGSMCERKALCHTSIVWGHFQTASMENNTRENTSVSWTRPRSTAR